jgi:hypothetical protein
MNYFSWIANLGVEPLLLFFALLFLPLFFSFCALLILVAAVRDAINSSFFISYLTRKFNAFSPYLSKYMLVFFMILTQVHAEESIFLGKGEQYILHGEKIKNFSIGNSEVISSKYLEKGDKLIIKGISIGFSDVFILNGDIKKHFKVYVLSKRQHLKKINAAQSLKAIQLNVDVLGEELSVSGVIDNEANYLTYLEVLKSSKQKILTQVILTKELRNKIFAKIYNEFYELGFHQIQCKLELAKIFCHYQGNDKLDPYLDYLIGQYQIALFNKTIPFSKNYYFKFKILELEIANQNQGDWQLSEINQNINDLMTNGVDLNNKTLQLNGLNLFSKVLAQPEFMMTMNGKNSQSLGSSVPFRTTQINGQTTTEWKFAGLKIDTEFKNINGKFHICYKTEFTQPMEQSIQGNLSEGCLYIELNKLTHLFKINLNINHELKKGIPFINKIPILKEIFSSFQHHDSNKQISVYATVEEAK